MLSMVTAEAGISFRTARRRVVRYQRFDLAALIRRTPMPNGPFALVKS